MFPPYFFPWEHDMKLLSTLSSLALVTFAASNAFAFGEDTPCGKFALDASGSLSCKIEVEGGCKAQCTPLSFKAGCTGGCTASASTSCTGSCGEQCIAECNPELLDCFAGCHAECDADVQALCEAKDPNANCAEQAVAQCDMHCETACEVPPSNCQDHCITCCNGGCQTVANFDCDFDCFAELKGGCDVQCSKPSGAIFCNGQYVYASDISACIQYLATQGIEVDASASATVTCSGGDCDLSTLVDSGCAAAPNRRGDAEGLLFFGMIGLGLAVARRRR